MLRRRKARGRSLGIGARPPQAPSEGPRPKYGFTDILENGRVVVDPSRVAAQIVSGIGFIGGGVIFVRKDLVRELTTASIVWLTAAVGMAAGAGLPILATAVTCVHFTVVFIFPAIERNLPKSRWAPSPLHISYEARRFARDSCCLHDSRIFGEPCASRRQAVTRQRSIGRPGWQSPRHRLGRSSGSRRGAVGRSAKRGDCNAPH
jgi:hypothetical protein